MLIPTDPPGRTNRKARAFTAEIGRLYAEGYSCEAIRRSLSNAGVEVSVATVLREARRSAAQQTTASQRIARHVEAKVSQSQGASGPTCLPPGLSARDFAADFVKSHITNPLIPQADLKSK